MLQCGMIIAVKYDQKQKQEIRKGGDCHDGKKVYWSKEKTLWS